VLCAQEDEGEGDEGGGGLLAHIPLPAAAGGGAAGGCSDGDGEGDLEGSAGGAAAAVLAEAARWQPAPVELDDARLVPAASFDIIATLVGIYGNTLFISEYKMRDCVPSIATRDCAPCFKPRISL
jgi:hypothetical protein